MSIVPFAERMSAKRQPLNRERIVSAALELLDEVGLDALTMRLLATRLGVKAASLYRHIADKDELLVHLADAVSAKSAGLAPDAHWREQVMVQMRGYRAALLSIRDGARLLAETIPAGPNRLKRIDELLGAVLASGCPPKMAAEACYHLNSLVVSFAADEGRAKEWSSRHNVNLDDIAERKRVFAAMLDVEAYPNLAPLAEFAAMDGDNSDEVFEFGIKLLLDGLEAHAAAQHKRK